MAWLGLGAFVSNCVCLSVVDVPLWKGVNPFILNQADVQAIHFLSSVLLLPDSLLLKPQPKAKYCSISFALDYFLNETQKAIFKSLHTGTSECKYSRTFAFFNLY